MFSPPPSDLRPRAATQHGLLKSQVSHFNEFKSLQTKTKALLHPGNHECLIVYAPVPRLCLFDSFVLCSSANAAGTFPLSVCVCLCTACSPCLALTRSSCRCRCSRDYVLHVHSRDFLKAGRVGALPLQQPQS